MFGASVDFSLFTHTQSDLAFDYNGNVFVQPACEGWGEELVPTDFTENVSIAVQTMLTPTLDSGHTRSFRMMQYQPMDLHSGNVLVDAIITTLFADINATDTTITVGNATTLDDPEMMEVITTRSNLHCNERITYEA